jgi:CRP/FNR family transcriptional regulator/CRP/FNR family cyclic AMP-dependent transcriptional regulator
MTGTLKVEPAELQLLSEIRLFSDLPLSELGQLAASMERRRYRAGEVIYHRRDVATGLFVITSGEVKTRIVLPDDRKLTFQWFRAGGFFGMNSLISETDRFTDAVAVTPCETLFLPKTEFLRLLETHPEAVQELLRVMAGMYLIVTEKMHDLAFLDIPGRIAKALLQLSTRRGEVTGPCVTISQTELASLVGATRESTNKALRVFEQEGWISRELHAIRIIDREQLRQRSERP